METLQRKLKQAGIPIEGHDCVCTNNTWIPFGNGVYVCQRCKRVLVLEE